MIYLTGQRDMTGMKKIKGLRSVLNQLKNGGTNLRAVQFVIQQTFSRTDAKQSEEKISLYLHIVH